MLNCDCTEYMAGLEDKAFDLAIVDPPYGINVNMNAGRKKSNASPKRDKKQWDDKTPDGKYFSELFRVSKNQIIWGGNYFVLPLTGAWVFWDKCVAPDASFSDGELAWRSFGNTLEKCVVPWSGFIGADGVRIHPTQKPVALYKWLLSRYAKPGDKILDTHGGSGSICIACHDLGYDLTWMELDADYYKAACERYKNHAAQGALFEPQEIRQVKQAELLEVAK